MPGSSDIARKLLPTRAGEAKQKINDNDLLFWTGERLGLLNFSARPGFTAEEFEEQVEAVDDETRAKAREERDYTETMRRALQNHTDGIMFTRHFGLGNGSLNWLPTPSAWLTLVSEMDMLCAAKRWRAITLEYHRIGHNGYRGWIQCQCPIKTSSDN